MIISDEQYEEMQTRITNLTNSLAYLINGKIVIIKKEDWDMFVTVFGNSEYSLLSYFNDADDLVIRIAKRERN